MLGVTGYHNSGVVPVCLLLNLVWPGVSSRGLALKAKKYNVNQLYFLNLAANCANMDILGPSPQLFLALL